VGEASKIIKDLQEQAEKGGGLLERIDVSQDMYDALVAECHPASPADALGIEVGVLPDGTDMKTLH
jgi:hypothetical protein